MTVLMKNLLERGANYVSRFEAILLCIVICLFDRSHKNMEEIYIIIHDIYDSNCEVGNKLHNR